MESLLFIIPISLLGLVVTVYILFKALKSGQFEDLERHGWSVVFDDREDKKTTREEQPPNE